MQLAGWLCLDSYSAMYNSDPRPYQFPAGHGGVAESYVKYQMYSNPPGYDARMTQYSYRDGSNAMPAAARE